MNESRIEAQLQAIIDNEQYSESAESRTERILQSIIDKTEYNAPPESRIEAKLLELKESLGNSSGTLAGAPVGIQIGLATSISGIPEEVI